jgi:hypothetical protein
MGQTGERALIMPMENTATTPRIVSEPVALPTKVRISIKVESARSSNKK